MSSTGLEMRRNRSRTGLCPGPHWGSLYSAPPDPLDNGTGRGLAALFPRTPSSPLPSLSRSPNTPKTNPSHKLGERRHNLIDVSAVIKQNLVYKLRMIFRDIYLNSRNDFGHDDSTINNAMAIIIIYSINCVFTFYCYSISIIYSSLDVCILCCLYF